MGFGKQEGSLCNFLRCTHAPSRNLIAYILYFLRGETLVHRSIYHSAGKGVYGDTAGCEFPCQSFCESIDSALGGRVSDFTGGAVAAPDRGDIQDFPGLSTNSPI